MKILSLYSIKGGAGKTANAVNIAYSASAAGINTLLVDLDAQGSSSFYFQLKARQHKILKRFLHPGKHLNRFIQASQYPLLDILPADRSYRDWEAIFAQSSSAVGRFKESLYSLDSYDLIVLDCPPGLHRLADNIFNISSFILVPVIPTSLSEDTFEQLYTYLQQNGLDNKCRGFFSMVQKQKKLHLQTINRMKKTYPVLLDSYIPFTIDIEHMGVMKAPAPVYAKQKTGGNACRGLWREIYHKLYC